LHDLIDLAVGLVPTLSTVHDVKDVDGHLAGVLDVKGPAAGPDGVAKMVLDDVSLWDEKFDHGSARFSLHGQEPRLQIESFELLHSGGAKLTTARRFGPEGAVDMGARTENSTRSVLDAA